MERNFPQTLRNSPARIKHHPTTRSHLACSTSIPRQIRRTLRLFSRRKAVRFCASTTCTYFDTVVCAITSTVVTTLDTRETAAVQLPGPGLCTNNFRPRSAAQKRAVRVRLSLLITCICHCCCCFVNAAILINLRDGSAGGRASCTRNWLCSLWCLSHERGNGLATALPCRHHV